MKVEGRPVEHRSPATELPAPSELRPPAPPAVEPGVLRLRPAAPPPAPGRPPSPLSALEPPPATAEGLASLAVVSERLVDEERDQEALAELDDAGRAALAPRLTAVRDMARALGSLLSMRAEVAGRTRGEGPG